MILLASPTDIDHAQDQRTFESIRQSFASRAINQTLTDPAPRRMRARHPESPHALATDEQHERDPDFGWLMLPRGAEELYSIWRAADYRADIEGGLRRVQRASPEIRQARVRWRAQDWPVLSRPRKEGTMESVCTTLLVIGGRRRRCLAFTRVGHRGTKVCAIRPIPPRSRRSLR